MKKTKLRKPISIKDCRIFTPEEIEFHKWKIDYLFRLGLCTMYDGVTTDKEIKLQIEIFGSDLNYALAESKAIELINNGQNVTKEIEDKLIKYKEALNSLE